MSICDFAGDGHFSVLPIIIRYIKKNGPTKRSLLLEHITINHNLLRDEDKKALKTLNNWNKLGLFTEKNEEINLDELLPEVIDDRQCDLSELLRSYIFKNNNQAADDFLSLLSWINLKYNSTSLFSKKELNSDSVYFTNSSSMRKNPGHINGFIEWGKYLQIFIEFRDGVYFHNPFMLLMDLLRNKGKIGEDYPINELIKEYSDLFTPYGNKMIEDIHNEIILDKQTEVELPSKDQLLMCIQVAIYTLVRMKLIKIIYKSDTAVKYNLKVGYNTEQISHIKIIKGL